MRTVELGDTVHWHGKVVAIDRSKKCCKTVTHSDYSKGKFGGDGVAETTFHFARLVWDSEREHWDFKN